MTVRAHDFALLEFLLDSGDGVSGSNHARDVYTFDVTNVIKIHRGIMEGLSAVSTGLALERPDYHDDFQKSRLSVS